MTEERRHPKFGDYVIHLDRQDMGLEDWAKVISVNYRDRKVEVRYFGGSVQYNGDQTVRIGQILHHVTTIQDHPELTRGGGDRETYDFDEFEDRWSYYYETEESEGMGAWIIGIGGSDERPDDHED